MSTVTAHANTLIDDYLAWLRSRMSVTDVNGYIQLVTPFLDRDNDQLVIYAKMSGNDIFLTDDCDTINGLISSGCDLTTQARKSRLRDIIMSHGLQLQGSEITAQCTRSDFPLKKHMMIQAMLTVGDMYLTQREHAASFFFDDVTAYFDANDIIFVPKPMFFGKSGLNQMFDFVIPRRRQPGRYVKLMNRLNKSNVNSALFAFQDVAQITGPIGMDVIYNDSSNPIDDRSAEAFGSYGVNLYPYSRISDFTASIQ